MATVIQRISRTIEAIKICKKYGNSEWLLKHEDYLTKLEDNNLPHGSGVDNGVKVDLENSTPQKVVFRADFHHMDENGYYDGWTVHNVTIRPTFDGLDISVSGKNRDRIKEYLHDLFYETLTKVLDI
jgi:hypothetical protein